MKNVGSSSRGSRRKETFFSQLPIERLSPHKSHNLGSHFSMVWVTATEAAPEVTWEWSPDKGKNILNAPSGLSAPLWEPARTEQGRKGFGALRWTKGPGLRFLTTDSLQNLRRTHTHLHISDLIGTAVCPKGFLLITHEERIWWMFHWQEWIFGSKLYQWNVWSPASHILVV